MQHVDTDVDIDVFGRDKILQDIECVFGRIDRADDKFEKQRSSIDEKLTKINDTVISTKAIVDLIILDKIKSNA